MDANLKQLLQDAHDATRQLAALSDNDISAVLTDTATVLKNHIEEILEANSEDLSRMDPKFLRCDS